MDECQLKGLCYNCDEKYFPGHKCKEQKLFMAISKDVPEEDVIVPIVEELSLPMPPRNLLTHLFPCMPSLASRPHKRSI
jgi:hypothetical protein